MMQIRKFVLVLGALVWLISQPYLGYAQMAESLKETYHHDGEEGVLVIDEPSMLLRLEDFLEEDQCKLIVLQLFADELTAEHCSLLLEKVREGNSLWFYDARLAGFFGMKSYRLRPDQFKNEPQEGVLGGKKCQGVATTVLAMGGHATLTGVGQATVFMPEFRDEKGEVFYSVLDPNTPGSALLRFTLDSPVVMGARRDGKGLIVFKTLLWPEVLSGDRLQRNLIEFSLGSPVPGPAGEGKIGNPPGPDAIWVGGVAPQSDSEGESVVEVVEEKEEKLSYRDRKRAQRRKLKQESFAAPDWMQKIQHDLAPGECCLINRAEEPMV